MKYVKAAFNWYFDGFWKMCAYFLAFGLVIALLQAMLVYPIQILTVLIVGFIAVALYTFFYGR